MANKSFFTSAAFVIVSPLYRLAQAFLWWCSGVQEAQTAASRAENYARSVHVQRVIWRNRLSHFTPSDASAFWTTHDSFDHPNVLLDPTISLYGISSTDAFFLKTDPNVDIYSSDTHPFMKWAQSDNAQTLYVMPLDVFHRFADEVGDPKHTVVWLSSIGRCGSTLLSQVLERVPGTVTLGEPDAVTALTMRSKSEKISAKEARRCLRSIVRLQCKTLPGVQRMVVKITGVSFEGVGAVHEMFPGFYHVFMYRDIIPYVVSTFSLMEGECGMRLVKYVIKCDLLSRMLGLRKFVYRNVFRLDRDDHKLDNVVDSLNFVGFIVAFAARVFERYTELFSNSVALHAVLYEDLVSEKEGMVRAVFRILDIPEKHVQNALTSFEEDSQRGSNLSRKSTGRRRPLSSSEILEADSILERFGFPKTNERIHLPGRLRPIVK